MNPPSPPPESTPPAPPVRLTRLAQIVLVLVLLGLLLGFVPRWLQHHRLRAETRADQVPVVAVVSPVSAPPDLGTPLPADVQAYVEAGLHARASGYLKNWFVDIGDSVTNGQLLAEIETPELAQQLDQARAQLDQARAAQGLARITADRWTELLKTASVSDQETAEKQADELLAQANVEAAQANVRRLEDLKSFDRVTAPFAGTITLRNTDIGHLIAADSGPDLFRLAQTDPLRVYVRVPQPLIHAITPGQTAALTFQEMPGRVFTATVTRLAGALDPASRTLQVELQAANPNGEIFAGSYAQVRFTAARGAPILTISDNTLIFRAQGMQVAVVGSNNVVQLHDITLGRDFGNIVQVLAGLQPDERVILNPPDAIADGMTVQVAPAATNTPAK